MTFLPRSRTLLWVQTAVFLTLFALALFSIRHKAPTFDEQSYITRGLAYLRHENRHMRVGHPLGLNAWNAQLLVSDENVILPTDDPSWELTSFHRPSELFMWEIGNDVEKIIWLGRVPTIWLLLLLAAVVARWTFDLTRKRWTAVFAMSLVAFDPNLLANGRLASTDLGLAFGALLAGWLLWRFFKRPSWQTIALAAVGFAILQNTKFTSGLFVPLFTAVILAGLIYHHKSLHHSITPSLTHLAAYPLIAFLTLWAMYGFQIGTLPDSLPTLPQLSGQTLPLAHHLEQLLDIGGRLTKSTPAFLLGSYSDSGWWYYFPVAFALKTPLPTLLLLLLAFGLLVRRLVRGEETAVSLFDSAALLLPPLGYFTFALTTDINLGYRHLLPVLPFFAVFVGREIGDWGLGTRDRGSGIGRSQFTIHNSQFTILPAIWLILIALFTFPHYLTFFNLFAGGADNGYRALVDSNLDWGQDLTLLKPWMAENGVDHVWLSYFGEARPNYYGVNYTGLDSFPPRLMAVQQRPFNPTNPAPGVYAISATTLMGVHFDNHQQFAYFWDKEPLNKLGNSIFLYEVEPFGEPVDLVLDEVQVDELTAVDLNRLSTNQLDLHWLYEGSSRYYPVIDKPVWVATRQPDDWLAHGNAVVHTENEAYTLLQLESPSPAAVGETVRWQKDGMTIEMTVTGNTPQLATHLQHSGLTEPVNQFIHLTDQAGNIVAQWDGLDTAWQGWHANDLLLQEQTLALPDELPTGEYQLWTGLYNPETAVRWQTEAGEERWLIERYQVSGIRCQVLGVRCQVKNCQLSIVNCQLSTAAILHSITPSLHHAITHTEAAT